MAVTCSAVPPARSAPSAVSVQLWSARRVAITAGVVLAMVAAAVAVISYAETTGLL